MKKIAIVTRQMIAGGIEKALISMLEELPEDSFDITLFVMSKGGEFEEFIPKVVKVKCVFGEENSTKEKVFKSLKTGSLIFMFKVLLFRLLAFRAKRVSKKEEYFLKTAPTYSEQYDVAIAYHTPAALPVKYVANHLNATHKIAWIHSDIREYKEEMNSYLKYYGAFDKIFCVSRYAMDMFNVSYPRLANKTEIFYNIINENKLMILANERNSFNDNFEGIRILTVGRLTLQKGPDVLPEIILKLKEEGLNFKWYWIGDGEMKEGLEQKTIQYNLSDYFLLLGTKKNPYPYFKDCDIYVQPSRHEGYCITLAEARVFNKPIVTTDFVGAREQIVNKETGSIVHFNTDEIYMAVKELILSGNIRNKYKLNLAKKNDFSNDIYKIVNY